jgi:hypothetical protein
MRIIALLFLLCTLCSVAFAQTTQCQSIPKASDRLACYDQAAPPSAVGNPAASKTAAKADKAGASSAPDKAPLADLLSAENKKLDAKIKGICRGC